MFRRKQPPTVELDADGYRRWIRAGRPPFEWFLSREPVVQETLAAIGDEERERERVDLASLLALAVRAPDRFESAVAEVDGDPEAESAGLLGIIQEFARAVAAPRSAPTASPKPPEKPPQFAGSGGSVESTIVERRPVEERVAAVSAILGRQPDGASVGVG